MSGSNNEGKKKERRFSQEQYDMLKRCSKKKDMTEWNEWREANPYKDILLEGAGLYKAHLEAADLRGAKLQGAILEGANLQGAMLERANLQDAKLWGANLQDAKLWGANLQGAILTVANLQDADLKKTNLEKAALGEVNMKGAVLDEPSLEDSDLYGANLEGVVLWEANLKGAKLKEANLKNAKLWNSNLECVNFSYANLGGADFRHTNLKGAVFYTACLDGRTLITKCHIDRKTDFRDVGLHNIRIASGTKQLLEYNIRRMNWEDWYKEHWFWRWPVQLFWAMSDYGMSTLRVVGVFFILAFLFAAVYMNWGYWRPPGIVHDLMVQPAIGEAGWHYFLRALIRPVYFSIVTMTTLGFGDMYANKGSIAGHVILAVQVILGYVLLGALITRFAVLFTAGGPAGKFAESGKGPG